MTLKARTFVSSISSVFYLFFFSLYNSCCLHSYLESPLMDCIYTYIYKSLSFLSTGCLPATRRSYWFQYGSQTRSWRVLPPSDPGRGSLWSSIGRSHIHFLLFAREHFPFLLLRSILVCSLPLQPFNSRHQKNGAVIARCSQPEISWWGWRNTDDEYLVTSIAKARQMDAGAKGACGAPACRQRGEAPDSSDSDFGKAVV